ncbi:SDR family NAD(P)-dependent oxidoreductase [Pontibacter anaerobius]|uniref:SDR family NAD(P)-dependent oxidoreductase n=1 Tax=Pontibacter anaerobius TaxID=2993940 RepID=A0ABT3RCR4_9BACT|nr:SDR family NAD(P)-dependent oxidoreductase [Pontibacter anaerobius]MCX2739414.1 SDR family NAD(P)-dependent oxidoreductase [Pontibacter anaerobius]
MSNNISGKVVIITGASNGIGYATAKLLAKEGAILSLAARRKEKLDQLVTEIIAEGGQAAAYATDITKRKDVEVLVEKTLENKII